VPDLSGCSTKNGELSHKKQCGLSSAACGGAVWLVWMPREGIFRTDNKDSLIKKDLKNLKNLPMSVCSSVSSVSSTRVVLLQHYRIYLCTCERTISDFVFNNHLKAECAQCEESGNPKLWFWGIFTHFLSESRVTPGLCTRCTRPWRSISAQQRPAS